MSLRSHDDQSAYERWADEIHRACRAADLPEPDNYGQRWYRGQSVAEVLGDMRVLAMKAEATGSVQSMVKVERRVAA